MEEVWKTVVGFENKYAAKIFQRELDKVDN